MVALEASAVAGFVALLLTTAAPVMTLALERDLLWLVAPACLFGYAITDLASGLVHWFCDTFFDAETPLIGPALIAPFREHHRDPLRILEHGFLELNGNSCLAALPLLACAHRLGVPGASTLNLFAQLCLITIGVSVAATNQFHRWAHDAEAPATARWLQRRRLILAPELHEPHHGPGWRGRYCITTGWWSGPLDACGVLDRIERTLKIQPKDVVG
jgi:ubiquitin-conjugating enzyme E2 variant